jgi:uncharacterized membrane protein
MIPDPLHPALVHMPLALVVLLPMFTLAALLVMRRGAQPRSIWLVVMALQVILSISTWAAVETGERDEDYFEHGSSEEAFEAHEELAEGFEIFAMVVLPLAAAGFLAGRLGQAARYLYLAATIGLLVVGAMVGHRGGAIIYPNGAEATAEALTS